MRGMPFKLGGVPNVKVVLKEKRKPKNFVAISGRRGGKGIAPTYSSLVGDMVGVREIFLNKKLGIDIYPQWTSPLAHRHIPQIYMKTMAPRSRGSRRFKSTLNRQHCAAPKKTCYAVSNVSTV